MQSAGTPALPGEAERVAFLSRPRSWPHAPAAVEVVETHMSWVFLAGDRVFKLKKSVRTGSVDFGTPALRAASAADELRLNRRLAPDVYLGLRPVRLAPGGALTLEGAGPIADWLVEMRRLPEERTLDARIRAGAAGPGDLDGLAAILVRFYRGLGPAPTTPARHAARFADELAETARVLTDPALSCGADPEAAIAAAQEAHAAVRPLLEARVRAGRIVEGHGDLRPEHVFLTEPPVVIDCLEFDRVLRMVDPFDEITLLGLDCAQLGADWVLPELRARLEAGLDDRPEPALLAFYWRYRALLRARLALLHLTEAKPRKPLKWRPLARRCIALAGEAEIRIRRK